MHCVDDFPSRHIFGMPPLHVSSLKVGHNTQTMIQKIILLRATRSLFSTGTRVDFTYEGLTENSLPSLFRRVIWGKVNRSPNNKRAAFIILIWTLHNIQAVTLCFSPEQYILLEHIHNKYLTLTVFRFSIEQYFDKDTTSILLCKTEASIECVSIPGI